MIGQYYALHGPRMLTFPPTPMPRSRIDDLLAVVLLAMTAACTSAPASRDVASARPVRVLVYNIHAGKDAVGADNLSGVAALVSDTRADLVLLQEVDQGTRRSGNVDQPAVLAERTGFHVAFGSALDYDGGEYGVAILSRWPITFDTLIHLPVDPPQERAGGSREPRGALRADIATPHGALTVFNTHIDASAADTWRRQEARGIAALVTAARATGSLVLVGGDLNSTPESAVQQDLRATGLRDAFAECGRGPGLTFPSDSAVKRIDYLYLADRIGCTVAEVPKTRVSDHLPLLVEVIIP